MGLTVDPGHRLANAVLSGMMFGHVLSEGVYPSLAKDYQTYDYININPHLMDDETRAEFYKSGNTEKVEGIRVGYTAMSQYILNHMSGLTIETLQHWADETLLHPAHQLSFVHGVGLALYANWDAYGDALESEGRSLNEDEGHPLAERHEL
jgi:hypothetical protein